MGPGMMPVVSRRQMSSGPTAAAETPRRREIAREDRVAGAVIVTLAAAAVIAVARGAALLGKQRLSAGHAFRRTRDRSRDFDGAAGLRKTHLEYDFTCSTTAFNSSVESSPAKYGIALAGRPSRIVRRRSSSVGGSPDAVDLYLNLPDEKSRGRGNIDGAAGPLPRPFGPWQTAQCRANTRDPSGAPRSKSAPGGQVRSAYCSGSGRYSALG